MSEEMNRDGRPVAIVTGAGSGIGREVAERLLDGGWTVVLVGRRAAMLDDVVASAAARGMPGRGIAHASDVTRPEDVAALVSVAREAGPIRALVNNAGLAELASIDATDDELVARALAVNVSAPIRLLAAVWDDLRGGTPERPGVLVNVSSRAAADPFPGFLAYAASKSAVESLARSVANEAGEAHVGAWNVAPGAVETPMLRGLFDESMVPREAAMAPDAVASAICRCIDGEAGVPSGATIEP